jgi:hypothetical protein
MHNKTGESSQKMKMQGNRSCTYERLQNAKIGISYILSVHSTKDSCSELGCMFMFLVCVVLSTALRWHYSWPMSSTTGASELKPHQKKTERTSTLIPLRIKADQILKIYVLTEWEGTRRNYVRLKKLLVNAAYENNCLYSDNHKQHINALSGCNAKFLDVKTCVVYSHSCTSNCSVWRSN